MSYRKSEMMASEVSKNRPNGLVISGLFFRLIVLSV